MEKAFENLEKWQIWLGKWFWYSFLWFLELTFLEPARGYWKLILKYPVKRWREKKYWIFALSILPLLCIGAFVVYGFYWLINDWIDRYNRKTYFYKIQKSYKEEVENFFKRYEAAYLARDCEFMRIVASDERMYDKYGIESYDKKKYDCPNFNEIQERYMKPIKIWELRESGNKMRVAVEFLWIDMVEGKPLIIKPLRAELWRTYNMAMWHFNTYKDPQTKIIPSQIWSD